MHHNLVLKENLKENFLHIFFSNSILIRVHSFPRASPWVFCLFVHIAGFKKFHYLYRHNWKDFKLLTATQKSLFREKLLQAYAIQQLPRGKLQGLPNGCQHNLKPELRLTGRRENILAPVPPHSQDNLITLGDPPLEIPTH